MLNRQPFPQLLGIGDFFGLFVGLCEAAHRSDGAEAQNMFYEHFGQLFEDGNASHTRFIFGFGF